jgi:hypothetical protein
MAEAGFQAIQRRFTAHLRDPDAHAGPADVDPRRLALYRELLYKNVQSFMANAFPVLRRLTDDARWHAMIGDYFARHRARTPLFPRMPQEFLRYLADERDDPDDPPWLRELAHYEWLEAEVLFDPREVAAAGLDDAPDFERGALVLNPVLRAHAYRFPVHRIGPDQRPVAPAPAPIYLVVFRRLDDSAGFMELNAVSARLIELALAQPAAPAGTLIEQIATELAHPAPAVVIAGGRAILEDFLRRGIVLGTRRPAA